MKHALVSAPKAHAKFSASGSKRWLACPGSIALSEKAPPAVESKWAAEGTRAHEALEFLARNRASRGKAVLVLRKKYPESMIIHAEMALDYVEENLGAAELLVEARCDLPVSEPNQFGTTDLAIIDHFGTLEVIDYKYGAGIPVPVLDEKHEENPQLAFYAVGLAHQFDYNFLSAKLTIIQPRAQIDGRYIRSIEFAVNRLEEWREIFEDGIKRAKAKNAPLRAGSHCRFCPAKSICPEVDNGRLRRAQDEFDDDYESV